ncbi:response regulator transcription factor [Donghicola sp. C2-DW-16]|uniref:Response regulator transcription factor n=1 Tax=Donghicola mangrovi TaxID=2729614 RepID=A0A850Q825_9RHOB|nr:response regulator transcription factor [Donghicola mangrovi]NVO22121.1 response regulator transcription factor [Donghicola mangrovi]NVO26288.1 response regulator transcription factor [Donghicola mangrovi]
MIAESAGSKRILMIDDHQLILDVLMRYFNAALEAQVDTAPDLETALDLIEDHDYDLILLDYNLPGVSGLSGLSQVLDRSDNTPTALISSDLPREAIYDAMAMGAKGYIPKTSRAEAFANAIRFLLMGETFLPAEFFTRKAEPKKPRIENLSSRESDVLLLVAEGRSNKDVANELGLSETTVKMHLRSIYSKIGVDNRTQAALWANQRKL